MPARYHINQDDHLISLHIDASASMAEVFEMGDQLLEDPDFQPRWPQLIDLRESNITPSETISPSLVNYLKFTYHPSIRASVAIIVSESISPEDCAAAYKLVCLLDNTEVFDVYAHAIRWLLRQGMPSLPRSLQNPDTGTHKTDKGPEEKRA